MSNEFLAFDRQYRAEEAAKTQRDERYRVATETAKRRKIEVKRALIMGPSQDFESSHVYRGNDSADEITRKCQIAYHEFYVNFKPTTDVNFDFLKMFLDTNTRANITELKTWNDALDYITQRLAECEPVEPTETKRKQRQGATRVDGTIEYEDVPEPQEEKPIPAAPVPEPKNPYIWGTKAYARFEKQRRQRVLHNQVLEKRAERERMLGRELAPAPKSSDEERQQAVTDMTKEVAGVVSNVIDRTAITVEGGYELPDEAKAVLIPKCVQYVNRYGIGAITPDRVRQFALAEWGPAQIDATEHEKRESELRTNDSESAEAYKRRIQRARQGG